jgi:hypothetical protein
MIEIFQTYVPVLRHVYKDSKEKFKRHAYDLNCSEQ